MKGNSINSISFHWSSCHLVDFKLLLSLSCLSSLQPVTSKKRQRKGRRDCNGYALEKVEVVFPWLLYELWMGQKVTCVPWILSVCLSIFLHGFQPNNSPAWLHHRLDMSPFLFVSFVTRRSACKVECNSLLSLSSQVSIHLFRRKGGHCTLDSDHL